MRDIYLRRIRPLKAHAQIVLKLLINKYTSEIDDYVKQIYDSNSDISHDYTCDEPETRNSLDTRNVNKNGSELPDLCKSTGMRIANVRKLVDLQRNFTCYDCKAL